MESPRKMLIVGGVAGGTTMGLKSQSNWMRVSLILPL